MRKQDLKALGLLAWALAMAAFPASAIAQNNYPPNGTWIPPVALTGGGVPAPGTPTALGTRETATSWNMEAVGHNDLQGRSAYQPIIINQDGRHIAYVGHHNNQKPRLNPLSGQVEVNGTSIVDVTDPAKTRYLAHIATGDNRATGGAQMARVCSGNTLPRGVKGKWYLLRPLGSSAHETTATERSSVVIQRASPLRSAGVISSPSDLTVDHRINANGS